MELPENKIVTGDPIPGHDRTKWVVEINNNVKGFTEDEIKRITRNYTTPIGKGGFGEVYRGVLDDECELVAVKRFIRGDLREEFMEEVDIHSQMNHKNVVKLLGYCMGKSTLTMVTEYVPKGNLYDTLHNSDIFIPLDIRLGIAIGCAEALSYMHAMHLSSDSLVCHGDIKPANILLGDSFTAKVSDFGLSRLLSGGITRYTRNVKGSIDYMDPIYLQKGRLTPRSDVYSFGLVLLELITRRRVKEDNFSLVDAFSTKRLGELVDPQIANEGNEKVLTEIGKLSTSCMTLDIDNRPSMKYLLKQLLKLWKSLQGGQYIRWRNNGLSIFRRNSVNSKILTKLGDVRIFTQGELREITKNYSSVVRRYESTAFYKGTLEDNTPVVLKISIYKDEWRKICFCNEAVILSHITHKNIIKLLGCWMEGDIPILVHEYATGGTLADIMYSMTYVPLELRLTIAVKIAEALAYMHSPENGVIVHGFLVPSKILLDSNLMPKISGFSVARRLIEGTSYNTPVDAMAYQLRYASPHHTELIPTAKSDVCSFGVLLILLVTRKPIRHDWMKLVTELTECYEAENTGRALFDKDIAAVQDIAILDEIGRIAIRCTNPNQDSRPVMEEVAKQLQMLWKSLKNSSASGEVAAQVRLPWNERHTYM